jgi:transposase, IS30 family
MGKRHHQAMVTPTERKSRYTLLRKAGQRTADQVSNAMIELLQPVADRLHMLMTDIAKSLRNLKKSLKS